MHPLPHPTKVNVEFAHSFTALAFWDSRPRRQQGKQNDNQETVSLYVKHANQRQRTWPQTFSSLQPPLRVVLRKMTEEISIY